MCVSDFDGYQKFMIGMMDKKQVNITTCLWSRSSSHAVKVRIRQRQLIKEQRRVLLAHASTGNKFPYTDACYVTMRIKLVSDDRAPVDANIHYYSTVLKSTTCRRNGQSVESTTVQYWTREEPY